MTTKPDHPTTDKATANLITALREFVESKIDSRIQGHVRMAAVEFPELFFQCEESTATGPITFKLSVDSDWWLTMGSTGPLTITDDPEWVRPFLKDQPKAPDYLDNYTGRIKETGDLSREYPEMKGHPNVERAKAVLCDEVCAVMKANFPFKERKGA